MAPVAGVSADGSEAQGFSGVGNDFRTRAIDPTLCRRQSLDGWKGLSVVGD